MGPPTDTFSSCFHGALQVVFIHSLRTAAEKPQILARICHLRPSVVVNQITDSSANIPNINAPNSDQDKKKASKKLAFPFWCLDQLSQATSSYLQKCDRGDLLPSRKRFSGCRSSR